MTAIALDPSRGVAIPDAPAGQIFADRARSFHWASRILSPEHARAVTQLYGICRFLDDVADDLPPAIARATLLDLKAKFQVHGKHPVVAKFDELVQRFDIDASAMHYMLDRMLDELSGVHIADADDLVRYGYDVAGVVGLWMTRLLGAESSHALPFAIDLGIAMQLTNIARDVGEDAARGRLYLPRAWLGRPVRVEDIVAGDPSARRVAHAAQLQVLELAADYYRSADRGMVHLPPRPRLCIVIASRVYAAIGHRIRKMGPAAIDNRSVVSTPGKCWQSLRALCAWPRLSIPGSLDRRGAPHDARLHTALRGRPGIVP